MKIRAFTLPAKVVTLYVIYLCFFFYFKENNITGFWAGGIKNALWIFTFLAAWFGVDIPFKGWFKNTEKVRKIN